jgi:hypothetical protein
MHRVLALLLGTVASVSCAELFGIDPPLPRDGVGGGSGGEAGFGGAASTAASGGAGGAGASGGGCASWRGATLEPWETGLLQPDEVVGHDGAVFWSASASVGGEGRVYRRQIDAPMAAQLATYAGTIGPLAHDGNAVYFTADDAVHKVEPPGSTLIHMLVGSSTVRKMAAANQNLYLADLNFKIIHIDSNGNQVDIDTSAEVHDLVIDDTHVFAATSDGVVRVPLTNGTSMTALDGLALRSVAVNAEVIYAIDGNNLYRIAKRSYPDQAFNTLANGAMRLVLDGDLALMLSETGDVLCSDVGNEAEALFQAPAGATNPGRLTLVDDKLFVLYLKGGADSLIAVAQRDL